MSELSSGLREAKDMELVTTQKSVTDEVAVLLPLLRRGAVSNTVKNAQALLIRHGYACGGRVIAGRETPDGEFGPATEKAVRAFQNLQKITVDGEIGKETWSALLTA